MDDLDSTNRFTDRASDYVRYRPTYPRAAYEAIVAGLGDPRTLIAADVGAGTGISARGLADLGPRVIAVEPNAAMRSAAEHHPRVEWRDGTAESTGLEGASVDVILCAQAYHWFDPERTCAEFARILRPNGRLALMWNESDTSDPVAARYVELTETAATERVMSRRTAASTRPDVRAPFAEPRVVTVPNEQRLDADGLIGRAMSASYVPRSGPVTDALVAGLRELHADRADADGLVTVRITTWIYLTERA
ncbi:MAG: methyltransferase domain-containing protein [Phycisphaerales bacterium]